MPYRGPGERPSPHEVLRRVLAAPPIPVAAFAPDAPPELVAVCEKAMAREPGQRYAGMSELGDDLRAYLEGRVVRAHRTGVVAELRKWIGRNRATAAALAVAAVLALGALGSVLYMERVKNREEFLASDLYRFESLERQTGELWPADPERVPALEGWLERARELAGRLELHEERLASFLERHAALARREDGRVRFPDPRVAVKHESLERLVRGLEGWLEPYAGSLARMEERLEFARAVEERTTGAPEVARLWREATAFIADPGECPAYGGLALPPQLGLVPLGRDPLSGLWEFAHLQTGAVPERDPGTGALRLGPEHGLVLSLIHI